MNAQPAGPALPGLMTARIAAGLVKAQAHAKATERRGVSGDGTYKYATADDLVADGKEALAAGGLSLLVYGLFFEDGGKVICRSATLVHESGDCLAVGPLRWPVVSDRGRPMDKAVATAMTSSLGYMFRDLLCIPRTTADGADMDARQDHAPAEQKAPEKTTADSTAAGVSPRAKQSPAGARMSRQNEEKSRERVDPEKVSAELSKAAEEVFGEGSSGLSVHVDLDLTMPPTKDVASNPSTSVGALPAGVPSNPDEKSSGVLPESGGCKTADDSSTPPGVSLDSTGGDNSTPESWAPDDATPERGRPVGQRVESPKAPESPEVLRRRTAEGRAAKWETAKRRQARKAFWCVLCQPTAAEANDAEDAKDRGRIKPKDWHYDGTPGRGCEACVSKIRDEAKEGACSATK